MTFRQWMRDVMYLPNSEATDDLADAFATQEVERALRIEQAVEATKTTLAWKARALAAEQRAEEAETRRAETVAMCAELEAALAAERGKVRELEALAKECEADHPPEPEYLRWVAAEREKSRG